MFEYSVVIPAHNEEELVVGAVESALAQTVAPREVIVVDDGSSDRTSAVCAGRPTVKVLRHEQVQGLSCARNSGTDAVSSEWVAFLDADDRWSPMKIERQAPLTANPAVGVVYCGIRLAFADGRPAEERPAEIFPTHKRLCRTLLWRNCITGSGSAVLIRRALLRECGGFDPSLNACEDWDCWLRLARLTEFAAVREPLVTLLKRPVSLGADPMRMFEAETKVAERHASLLGQFPDARLLKMRARARRYENRALIHLQRGERHLALMDYLRSAIRWPFRQHTLVPLAKLLTGYQQRGRS